MLTVCNQRLVAVLIDAFAAPQDENAVGSADFAEAVRDDEGGSFAGEASHGSLDLIPGGAVDGSGGIVEDQGCAGR